MSDRPNILLIYTDQQRWDTLGVNGNDLIRTPRLDAFARSAVQFTRGYVTCPLCVPSRVACMTGRYNRANLSWNNHQLLLRRETHLPGLLRENGYTTALIGKDHCFSGLCDEAFEYQLHAGHTSIYKPRDKVEEQINKSRQTTMQVPFADDPVPGDEGITARLCREAVNYLKRDHKKPWFMWLSIPDPHPPYMVGAPYDTMYDETPIPPPAWREGEMRDKPHRQQLVVEWDRYGVEYPGDRIDRLRRTYWGQVSCIDTHVGRVLDTLDELGLAEDTVVVFTSDHGDYMGDHRMIRKGPHLYEALTHVPLMIRHGSRFLPQRTDAFASNIDLMPTLCELAGVKIPPQVQGISQVPVLEGYDAVRSLVFLEHGDPGVPLQPGDLDPDDEERLRHSTGHHLCDEISRGKSRAVRSERYKYIFTTGDVDELYDLEADPDELVNLAAKPGHEAVIADHRSYLLRWAMDSEDTLQR